MNEQINEPVETKERSVLEEFAIVVAEAVVVTCVMYVVLPAAFNAIDNVTDKIRRKRMERRFRNVVEAKFEGVIVEYKEEK